MTPAQDHVSNQLALQVENDARSRLRLYEDAAHDERARCLPKISQALQRVARFHREHEAARTDYLRKLTAESHPEPLSSSYPFDAERSFSRYVRPRDVSADALNAIQHVQSAAANPIPIPVAPQLPSYEAWVPVVRNFYVSDIDMGHFIPYFGDSKKKINMAQEVSELMRRDITCALEMDSDLEAEENLDKDVRRLRLSDEEKEKRAKEKGALHGLRPRIRRVAMHRVLLELTQLHGKGSQVWAGLSAGLDEPKVRHLERVCALIERRREEEDTIRKQKRQSWRQMELISRSIAHPEIEWPMSHFDADGNAAAALKYFCFNCHDFACHHHKGENVPPVVAIPDSSVQERMEELGNNQRGASPCSRCCFLLEKWQQCPAQLDEGMPWTLTEEAILSEAVKVFQLDPCRLAVTIRTKTCREVNAKIRHSSVARHLKQNVNQSKAPRLKVQRQVFDISGSSGSSSDDQPVLRKLKGKSGRSRNTVPVPQKRKPKSTAGEDQPFIPCNHHGPCKKESECSCALRGVDCESRCGCKYGRCVQGREGMYNDQVRDGSGWAAVRLQCTRRTYCECKTGACNTEACPCYERRKACNPDMCHSCGCSALPSVKSAARALCRNTSMVLGTHKQTFVGRSKVHGFGLFAGESFLLGDLVGQYAGRLMTTELVDKALRVSQAKHETFAFKLDEELTVDGGLLGSKVKFVNHAEGDLVNCVARCERIRGEIRIALKTCRPVLPGEEFLFNYEMIDASGEGNEWIVGGGTPEKDKQRASSRKTGGKARASADEVSPLASALFEVSPPSKDNAEKDLDFEVSEHSDLDDDCSVWK